MSEAPSSDDQPDVPVVLLAVFGCFAAVAVAAYFGVVWADVHAPRAVPELLRSLRPEPAASVAGTAVSRAPLQSFALEIINIDGRIHHAAYASYEGLGGQPEVDATLVRGLALSRTVTPAVARAEQLLGGGGIVAADPACFVLDSGADASPRGALAMVTYNDTGVPLTAEVGFTDKLGGASPKLALWLRVAGTAAPFRLDSLAKDHRVVVRVVLSAAEAR